MSARAYVELESLKLADSESNVYCFICDTANTFDAETCRNCNAPMAIAHQARMQRKRPQTIACIGSAGAGKTVYLGMLMDMLSRDGERLEALARGAFSVNLQQHTAACLSRCEFPPKTPNEPDHWHWVHCQVRQRSGGKSMELIVPDMAGDSLLAEIEHPGAYPVIRNFLERCSGAIVLVDGATLPSGRGPDYFAMKLLSYLAELAEESKNDWKKRPLAVVFTKADQCEEAFSDPAAFARRHATGLWRHCKERFRKYQFFASGVAGACSYRESRFSGRELIPLRIEPRGIVEPFEWVLTQLR